jgi:hypothetical protein
VGEEAWSYTYSIPTAATSVEFVFNDGAGGWDNNGGADWTVPVTGGTGWTGFEMDGVLDDGAQLVASGDDLDLYAAFDGTWLYVATQSVAATAGMDHFILVDDDPDGSRPAPWVKSGTVAGWDYFVGSEDDNGWAGWFDSGENPINTIYDDVASNVVLEAVLDLVSRYGGTPDSICIAVAGYGSADAAALLDQAPPGNGNGNVERPEYYVFSDLVTGAGSDDLQLGTMLLQATPNPAFPQSTVRFSVSVDTDVSLSVYDVRGRLVSVLQEGLAPAGEHEVVWRGLDRSGRELPAGVYFCRLATPNGAAVQKIVLLR